MWIRGQSCGMLIQRCSSRSECFPMNMSKGIWPWEMQQLYWDDYHGATVLPGNTYVEEKCSPDCCAPTWILWMYTDFISNRCFHLPCILRAVPECVCRWNVIMFFYTNVWESNLLSTGQFFLIQHRMFAVFSAKMKFLLFASCQFSPKSTSLLGTAPRPNINMVIFVDYQKWPVYECYQ